MKQAAKRILASVRNEDTVARLGGDEFTVILLDIADIEQIKLLAQNIINELEKPYDESGSLFSLRPFLIIKSRIYLNLLPDPEMN
jgi:diguanylate cyclase (GGDEF)-like protein